MATRRTKHSSSDETVAIVAISDETPNEPDYERFNQHELDGTLFNPTTGEVVKRVTRDYTWARSNKRNIRSVKAIETPSGGGIITFVIDETLAFRQVWGSFELMSSEYKGLVRNEAWYKLTLI